MPSRQGRFLGRAGQAALGLLLLGGCDAVATSTPVLIGRDILGYGPRLEPAPGADRPYPNLASVPPRPTPPDAATRAAMMDVLAGDRSASRAPLAARTGPEAAFGADAPGNPPLPSRPPPPPILSTPRPVQASAPAAAGSLETAPDPGAPPPPPSADLLAPPAPPAPDLLAPPPPRLR